MLFEDLPNVSNKKVPSVSANAEMFPVVSNIFVFLRQRHSTGMVNLFFIIIQITMQVNQCCPHLRKQILFTRSVVPVDTFDSKCGSRCPYRSR